MENVVLVIHLILALGIIGLVLLQRSEGGGLGMGGGGGLGGLASARGTANALTKATSFAAAAFFCTSLILGILAAQKTDNAALREVLSESPTAIEGTIDTLPIQESDQPPEAPVAPLAE